MEDEQQLLRVHLKRLLQPLVRFLIKKNITLRPCMDMLKEVYIDAAEEELRRDMETLTDSHISLITGMHRKDVKKYRVRQEQSAPPPNLSLGAELLVIWTADEAYTDDNGKPLPLPYIDDNNHSFTALVEGLSKDIRPRAVLDEFLRLGIVEQDSDTDILHLKKEAFIPEQDFQEKLYYFSKNNGDHLAAAVHNLLGEQPPLFDRCVYYDGLSNESIDELKKLSSTLAMDVLHEINLKAYELSERDNKKDDIETHRINFGSYFYSDAVLKEAKEE